AVYQRRCASCHDSGDPKVPSRDALKKLSAARILRSMDFGTMAGVANPLRRDERDAVGNWLGGPGNAVEVPAKAYCADRTVALPNGAATVWNGWSPAATNTRYQPTGFTPDQVRRLKLKWAYGFDHDIVAFAQPTIVDRFLFVGSGGG